MLVWDVLPQFFWDNIFPKTIPFFHSTKNFERTNKELIHVLAIQQIEYIIKSTQIYKFYMQ